MQLVPVLQQLHVEIYPSMKGEDMLYAAFTLHGVKKRTFEKLGGVTIELPSVGHGGFDFEKPDHIPDDDIESLKHYIIAHSNQREKSKDCFNCENYIYSPTGKFPPDAMCPTCAVALYEEQERVILEKEKRYAERLDRAAKLAVRTTLPAEMIAEVLLYRPNLEAVFAKIRPSGVERSTEELKKGIFISNEAEPLFNIGRWGKPYYDSCQDWADMKWSEGHLRSIHHLEDPDVFVLWKGTEDQMMARFLVRRCRDFNDKNKLLLGIDAPYGMMWHFGDEMIAALEEYAKRDGSEVVRVTPLRNRDGAAPNMMQSRHLARFSNDIGSYADIGRWFDVPETQGGKVHCSGYERLVKVETEDEELVGA